MWRIRSLHRYVRFLADYERGWAEAPLPAPSVSEALPPDRPPTVRYAAFPSFYVPPIAPARPE